MRMFQVFPNALRKSIDILQQMLLRQERTPSSPTQTGKNGNAPYQKQTRLEGASVFLSSIWLNAPWEPL